MDYLKLDLKEFNEAGFTGYASTFGNIDLGGDVIAKGAFIGASNVPILISHDTTKVIGVTTSIYEDEAGLFIEAQLADTQDARDARALMAIGALTGLSIGYIAKSTRPVNEAGKRYRLIEAIDLYEVSLTPTPMNTAARVQSVKEALDYHIDMNEDVNDVQADLKQEQKAEVKAAVIDDGQQKAAIFAAKVNDLSKRIDELEANQVSVKRTAVKDVDGTMDFKNFITTGKALNTMVGSEGGFLAPAQFVNRLIEQVVLMSPVRQAATVITASAGEVQIPKRTSAAVAQWTGELQSVTASQPAFGLETIPVNKLAAQVEVSVELLQDAAFDIEAYLTRHLAEQFAAAEGDAFLTGNAAGQPQGILTAIAGGAPAALSYDALVALAHSNILAAYMPGLSFAMNLATLGEIMALADTSGMPLVSPAFSGSAANLFGYPVRIWATMPDNVILFGNFAQGYYIVDRGGVNLIRDPYSAASRGAVVFTAFRRVGGRTVNPQAISRLNLS